LLQYHESKTGPLSNDQLKISGRDRIFESKIVLVISFDSFDEGFAFSQEFGLIYIHTRRCFSNGKKVDSLIKVGENVKVTLTRSFFRVHTEGYLIGSKSKNINLKLDSLFKYKAIKCWPTCQSKPKENVKYPKNKPSPWMRGAFSEEKFLIFLDRLTVSLDDFESMILAYTKTPILPTLRQTYDMSVPPEQPLTVKTTSFQPIMTSAKTAVSKYGLFPNYGDIRQSISRAEEIKRLGFDLDELAPIVDISDGIGVMNLA